MQQKPPEQPQTGRWQAVVVWGKGCIDRCGAKVHHVRQWAADLLGESSRSLTNRILVLQLAWAIVVYALVIATLWYASSLVIENSLRTQGESWVARLDELGTPLYASDNPAREEGEIAANLAKFPEVAQVTYYAADGKDVLASYSRQRLPKSGLPMLSPEQLISLEGNRESKQHMLVEEGDRRLYRFSAPVAIKSIPTDGMLAFSLEHKVQEQVKVIGFVSVLLDYSRFYTDLNYTMRNVSIVVGVLLLVMAIIGRVLIRWSLKLLTQLEEPLNRLARGETDVRVESGGDREIAKIGMALNTTIDALRERDETLQRMVNQDPMTGLMNRKHFSEMVEQEIQRIRVEGGTSALLFIDLDRFKFINDTYGHAAGDRLLIQVANMLNHRMRHKDSVARYGGDEFTALVVDIDGKRVGEIAQSLLDLMGHFRFQHDNESVKIHFSIGITLIDEADATASEYLMQADKAVHQAKEEGRNRYHIYVPQQDAGNRAEHTGWHARLEDAIANDKFSLHFQPVISLNGAADPLYEALLRLQDEEKGLIPPSAFFPAAERFEMMAEIDRLAIKKAVHALKEYGSSNCTLSINLSEQVLTEEGFIDYLRSLIQESGIDTRHLVFEVSERLAVYNAEQLKPQFAAISAMGCGLAIDDYGAGYASFQYLKHSPVQWLKIDSSLIDGLLGDKVDQVTVQAIAETAAMLGMKTVAKFVPNKKTLEMVQKLGVDYVQGNYLYEPAAIPCKVKHLSAPRKRSTVKKAQ